MPPAAHKQSNTATLKEFERTVLPSDPIYRDTTTLNLWKKKVAAGTPHPVFQPPRCSIHLYFPQVASRLGFERWNPTEPVDYTLTTHSRGVKCAGGLLCHNKEAIPAFIYT
jgi:hypothetical protein